MYLWYTLHCVRMISKNVDLRNEVLFYISIVCPLFYLKGRMMLFEK